MKADEPQSKSTVTNQIWVAWQATAPERMAVYQRSQEDRDELDAIARYLWNQALCEAITPALHIFEVSVRNAIHGSMVRELKREDWYNEPGLLRSNEAARLDDAKNYLRERAREKNPSGDPEAMITPGRVVAELTFGFWCALFSSPYEDSIVRPVLAKGMKKIPQEQKKRGRSYVAERLKRARDIRNRVFHHEAIYHLNDLNFEHDMLLEFSGWLYPNFTTLCRIGNRFGAIYQAGPNNYRNQIVREINARIPAACKESPKS